MPRTTDAPRLTPREREIVRLISLGCSSVEIASILNLAQSTVDNHRYAAMAILKTDKAALVTRLAVKYGFSSADDKLTRKEQRLSGRTNDGWN